MAYKKRNSKRYNPKTYKVYGIEPMGNHYLNIVMRNDYELTKYVEKNHNRLAKMRKDDAIKEIKAHAHSPWAKEDLKKIKSSTVKSDLLRRDLRNFNN